MPARKKQSPRKPAKKKAPAKKTAPAKKATPVMYRGPNLDHHPVSLAQMSAVAHVGLRSDGEILQVEASQVAPCRLVDHGGGRFSLCLDDYAMPQVPLFAERGLQGGGYTWEAVVQSLVNLRHPKLAQELSYDSEAGMFVALGSREALVQVAKLIQSAVADAALMRAAVDGANPDALE